MVELILTLPLLLAALLAWVLPPTLRSAAALAGAAGSGLLVLSRGGFLVALDPLFGLAFCLTAGLALLYGWRRMGRGETCFTLLYTASAVAAVSAQGLYVLYVCWELMAVFSTFVILCSRTRRARTAALRYVLVHLAGGLLFLASLVGFAGGGSVPLLGPLGVSVPAVLLLLAVLVNVAAWPLSAWLPDAYPETTPAGGVFLQAMTTKTAVYVLLTCFMGWDALVWIGVAMALYGTIYGAVENDVRRMLAYGIVNQTGFMVAGAGIGTRMALAGAAGHAAACIVYTALLWMAAGSVMRATGKRHLADVGGLGRSMPLTAAMGWIGALSMAALPGTSGYATKTFVLEAGARMHMIIPWVLLEIAAAGVVLHGGLRFVWQTFHGPRRGPEPARQPAGPKAAMLLAAALCLGVGLVPAGLHDLLPNAVRPNLGLIFNPGRMAVQVELLAFAALGFFAMLPWLPVRRRRILDADVLYTGLGRLAAGFSRTVLDRLNAWADRGLRSAARRLEQGAATAPGAAAAWILLPCRWLRTRDPEQRRRLAETARAAAQTGTTPAGVSIFLTLLTLFLLLALFFRPT
jgi:multicomponent Na+:H+ antiporter subunit D